MHYVLTSFQEQLATVKQLMNQSDFTESEERCVVIGTVISMLMSVNCPVTPLYNVNDELIGMQIHDYVLYLAQDTKELPA